METQPNTQIRTAGGAWGPQRVALGLSLRALAKLSGVNIVTLSLAEQGRLVPTGDEYQRVMRALDSYRKPESVA
jgi:transcriptional regulator with XRE-family HTH domain